MSVGPTGGIPGSIAGSSLAQTQGNDVNRAQKESTDQLRQINSEQKAESASGIGETEEEHGAEDRDADGRRLWEKQNESKSGQSTDQQDTVTGSKDPTKTRGNEVDLSG